MASTTPPWPSLYNPSIEILHIEHRDPVQPGAAYLSRAKDVFLFTFYWTLIFYTPLFLFSGSYAFFNLAFRPRVFSRDDHFLSDSQVEHEIDQEQSPPAPLSSPSSSPRNNNNAYTYIPLQLLQSPRPWTPRNNNPLTTTTTTLIPPAQKKNARRSRVTYALLVLLVFLAVGLAGAVVNSAILGFVVLGLYRAGHFHMSTWIPFLLAVLQVSVGLLSIWPSTIEII